MQVSDAVQSGVGSVYRTHTGNGFQIIYAYVGAGGEEVKSTNVVGYDAIGVTSCWQVRHVRGEQGLVLGWAMCLSCSALTLEAPIRHDLVAGLRGFSGPAAVVKV